MRAILFMLLAVSLCAGCVSTKGTDNKVNVDTAPMAVKDQTNRVSLSPCVTLMRKPNSKKPPTPPKLESKKQADSDK